MLGIYRRLLLCQIPNRRTATPSRCRPFADDRFLRGSDTQRANFPGNSRHELLCVTQVALGLDV